MTINISKSTYFLIYILITIFLFIGFLLIKPRGWWDYALLIISIFPVVITASQDIYQKHISTDVFLLLAATIGIIAGQIEAITTVLIIMLIAKYVEGLVTRKTKQAALSLIKLMPQKVAIQTNDGEIYLDITMLKPDMLVIGKTGVQIPIDGIIVDGTASINESFLTGESIPKAKTINDLVFAGTFIEDGAVVIKTNNVGNDTLFGKISKMLEQAEKEKANIINVSNKAALIVVQILMIFCFIVWLITKDLNLLATILIFGSPIELTLITPLAILAATAAAFRHGILVKGSLALEKMAHVDTIIFDKTGTLTLGQLNVIGIESFTQNYNENDILKLAAMMEQRSGHVIAKAIINEAKNRNILVPKPDSYESITGHGIIATLDKETYLLGNEHFISAKEHGNIAIPDQYRLKTTDSYFYLSTKTSLLGRIKLRDTIRSEAKKVIKKLAQQGITKSILLSGDLQKVAEQVGQELNINEVHGEVEPHDKLSYIKNLQKQHKKIVMVGDGINDAPALAQADVGIAMGAMGMEPAIAAADIVLMANDLNNIIFIHRLAKKVIQLIKQNIFLGFGLIHVLGITLALMSLVSPIEAALFHAISDLLILLNSARLVKFAIK